MSVLTPPSAVPPIGIPQRKGMNYRWLAILLILAVLVSIVLVYAENRVYEPATPFLGGTGDHVHAFVLDPMNARHIYMGTHYGFFRSDDGGQSWSRLNSMPGMAPTLVVTTLSISPIDAQTTYVDGYLLSNGNAGGVFVTHNNGASWHVLPTGKSGELPDPRILFITAGWSQPGEAYAYSFNYGLYGTTDWGESWQFLAQPFQGQVTSFTPIVTCGSTIAIIQSGCAESFIAGTTQGLYLGTRQGAAIQFTAFPQISGYIYSVAVHRGQSGTIAVSSDQGIFEASAPTMPFTEITNVSQGAPTLTSIAIASGNANVFFGVTQQNTVVISHDSGKTWDGGTSVQLNRGLSQLSSGLRSATGQNTPQWAGGQNIYLTVLQTPVHGDSNSAYAAVSFPVQMFSTSDGGRFWAQMH